MGGVVTVLIARGIFKFGVWKGSVDTDRTNFKEFMAEIKEIFDQIFSRLPPLLVANTNPLSLTDLDKNISNQLSATQWADKTAIVVLEKIKEPYDIQEFSFEYAQKDDSYSENERTLTRNVAYENGID